jgi:2-methylcitrate dehydratase PrpD
MINSQTRLLARFASTVRADQIKDSALMAAQMSLADALAVMLAASRLGEGCAACVDIARISGTGPCVVIGHEYRTSAPMAAFANGAMAHAMDFEDTHDHAIAHPHAAAIPAALAICDMRGNVGGDELLAAIAIGADLVCRIAASFEVNPDDFGWHTTPWLGVFGAATAAGRLLNLDTDQMLDAWSLAMSQMASFGELKNSPTSHMRAIRDAFAAKAGVMGALMAQRGLKGYSEPLQGGAGFFAAVSRNHYAPQHLVEDLGERFMGAEVSFKPWPSCRGTHAYIDAGLRLQSRIKIDPAQITRIDVIINSKNRMLCEPRDIKIRPDNAINAKFSIPFTTAIALLHGHVSIASFNHDSLTDASLLELSRKVEYQVDEKISLRDVTRGSLFVHMGGQIHSEHIVHALGHPDVPLTPESFRTKFDDCVKQIGAQWALTHSEQLWNKLWALRSSSDVRDLTQLLHISKEI